MDKGHTEKGIKDKGLQMKHCPKCNRLNIDEAEYCLCGKHKWPKEDCKTIDEAVQKLRDMFGIKETK